MSAPKKAIILAAGLGMRMRPLTERIPKPLVEVAGRPLIDWSLDFLHQADIKIAVVNTSYLADMLESHLAQRTHPQILVSREDTPLETGGGIAHALPLLGEAPFYSLNSDAICVNEGEHALTRLHKAWDAKNMDALLLLTPTEKATGYSGAGDFSINDDGSVKRREKDGKAPYVFTGVQIIHPRLFENCPDGAFSLNHLYDRDLSRIHAITHNGAWLHVGDLMGLARAEAFLHRAA